MSTWEDLAAGLRPDLPPMEDGDIYQPKHGWQHLASSCTDTSFVFTRMVPSLSEAESDVAFTGKPTGCLSIHVRAYVESRFDPQPFRILMLRRLRLPIPLAAKACRCGRLHDVFGHHRSACAVLGVLGARVCREAGARVSTNVFMRDLDD